MIIRNWRDATPHVGHENVVIHYIFSPKGAEGRTYEEAPIEGGWSLTRHMIQPGKQGDEHEHDGAEQVFYFTKGNGQMKLDGKHHDIKDGDAVHVPPGCMHQTINNSNDWLELLIITARLNKD